MKQKPDKPRPDYPLTAHNNGQWCKKILGTVRFFGPWGDPCAAERLYLDERADWEAGRNPRTDPRGGFTLLELADRWIDARYEDMESADDEQRISRKSYLGSRRAMERLLQVVPSADRIDPMTWRPDDWKRLRAKLGEGVRANTKAQYIMYVRALFNWARKQRLIPGEPDWADQFKCVSADVKYRDRYLYQQQHGDRCFTVEQAKQIIAACYARANRDRTDRGHKLRRVEIIGDRLLLAGNLLAANTGAYGADIAALEIGQIDLERGYVENLRTKTDILWQATLWPETVEAIRSYLEVRPEPARDEWSSRLFLTAQGFATWHQVIKHDDRGQVENAHETDALAQATGKLLRELGIKAPGVGFGTWRHTFESLADEFGSESARRRITGRKIAGSKDAYIKLPPDKLRRVTDGVRSVLFDAPEPQPLRLVG